MKKIIRAIICSAIMISTMVSCNDTVYSEDVDTLKIVTQPNADASDIISFDGYIDQDIYASGVYADPSIHEANPYALAYEGKVYYNVEYPLQMLNYVDERSNEAHPICMDPVCTHGTESCVANLFYGRELTIAGNYFCYVTRDDNENNRLVVRGFHAEDMEWEVLYSSSNSIVQIFSMGKFLYISEETDHAAFRIIRLDLDSKKAVAIPSEKASFFWIYPHDGYLYYRENHQLWRMDSACQNHQLLIDEQYVLQYDFYGDYIYYNLVDEPSRFSYRGTNEHSEYVLKRYHLSTGEKETVMEDVINFCFDQDDMIYIKNNPIYGAEADYFTYDKGSGQTIKNTSRVAVLSGNKVCIAEMTEQFPRGTRVLNVPENYMIQEDIMAVNGYVYANMRQVKTNKQTGNRDIIIDLARISYQYGEDEWLFLTDNTNPDLYE